MTASKPPVKPKPPEPDDPAAVLTVAELAYLGRLLGRNLKDKEALLKAVKATTTLTVEGVPVTLEPRLLERLKSRCLDKNNFSGWLKDVVIKQLHDYAGW